MPSRAQLMKQQKSMKKIDSQKQLEKATEEQPQKPIKQLQTIPQDVFRNPTYIYQDQVAHNHLFYRTDEETSDEIVGYLTEPLAAPGYEDYQLTSKNYPRLTLAQLPSYKHGIPPIVILRSEPEVLAFQQMAKIDKQPLYDYAGKAFDEDKIIWFLPDKTAIAVEKDCESVGQAIEKLRAKKDQEPALSEEEQRDRDTQTQLPKIKKILFWITALFILVVCAIFAIQSKYFDHVITKDNKLVDIGALYETMELLPGAKKGAIKKQYRKLAVKYHPDRNPDCADCAEKFDKISAAYKQLVPGDAYIPTGFDSDTDQVVRMKR